jgi:hypothetical protein
LSKLARSLDESETDFRAELERQKWL